jgi:hypothetical protein
MFRLNNLLVLSYRISLIIWEKQKSIFILLKVWRVYPVKVAVIDQCMKSVVIVHCPQNYIWFRISQVSIAPFCTAIIQHFRKVHTDDFNILKWKEKYNNLKNNHIYMTDHPRRYSLRILSKEASNYTLKYIVFIFTENNINTTFREIVTSLR